MKNPKIFIKLDGYTDSRGTPEYNQALGERRANVVKQYMLSKGVKAESVELNSYGESKPAADNATDAGSALNRRVELLVVEDGFTAFGCRILNPDSCSRDFLCAQQIGRTVLW